MWQDIKKNLEVHMKMHNEEKPYQCIQCDKPFSKQVNLNIYLRIQTGENIYIQKCLITVTCVRMYSHFFIYIYIYYTEFTTLNYCILFLHVLPNIKLLLFYKF